MQEILSITVLCEQLLPGHQAKSQTGSGTMQQVPLEALFCAALSEPERGKHWLKTPYSLGEQMHFLFKYTFQEETEKTSTFLNPIWAAYLWNPH